MHRHPLTSALVFAATLSFLLVGILGGFLLRSWRALPILALGILLGGIARIVNGAGGFPGDLRADAQTIRLLGKGAFGLLLAYAP